VCVLIAVQRATQSHTARHSVHTPPPFYKSVTFSKVQLKLPEDGPNGPKYVGANIKIF
jgi:hypothetical protein